MPKKGDPEDPDLQELVDALEQSTGRTLDPKGRFFTIRVWVDDSGKNYHLAVGKFRGLISVDDYFELHDWFGEACLVCGAKLIFGFDPTKKPNLFLACDRCKVRHKSVGNELYLWDI